jgi:hypothetical protein
MLQSSASTSTIFYHQALREGTLLNNSFSVTYTANNTDHTDTTGIYDYNYEYEVVYFDNFQEEKHEDDIEEVEAPYFWKGKCHHYYQPKLKLDIHSVIPIVFSMRKAKQRNSYLKIKRKEKRRLRCTRRRN